MKTKQIIATVMTMALLAALCLPAHGQAQNAADKQGTISLDFKSVDIHILIKFISELTDRNFIVDNKVRGAVTVYSPKRLTVKEAYRVFESILEVNGLCVVPDGQAYRIEPIPQAVTQGAPTAVGLDRIRGEGLVTQIIPLENSSATELAKLLTPLIGKNGNINVYKPSNTLIITASHSSVRRALSILSVVDKGQAPPVLRSYPLQYGDAKGVATSINRIVATKTKEMLKNNQQAFAMVEADPRTNTVIALTDPTNAETVASLVEVMDVPTPKGKDDIHLINLSNAKAEDVAKVLQELVSTTPAKEGEKRIFSKDIKVVADNATNSLVITARPDEFRTLKQTISQLDVLRKQVFIEALIMEVSTDTNFSFGVNWAVGGSGGDTSVFGSSNTGGGSLNLPDDDEVQVLGFPAGGSIGAVLSNAIKIGDNSYSLQGLISASKSSDGFKILSTPQLMTLDNETASVNVVDNIPFVTQTSTNTNNTDYNEQDIDYKDVGVKLEITPHISDERTLRLEIKQEVSRVVDSQVKVGNSQLLAPTTKKREVETSILMRDGQTVVIAGLLGDDETQNNSKVPGLGDIPLLGWLFKYKKTENQTTNLYIFLTPHVIDTFDKAETMAKAKRSDIMRVKLGGGKDQPLLRPGPELKPVLVR
ncbi:type II secretion system secretin GspD [Pseudodesulfovibrio senegalensis]|uniref:Type II secretion system protein GspD n=1 Tax=Pseudodesulfovibrio senegalensis TaxID=1721087 RepID=A0A6N6N0Q3_9BACT|nr:type II secretion system secretin GspD [Pseudodesulfovibrio senegalensis]KAB1441419.1 type II secretion system protein GspD [Pseudodesulfovibrio senegalensis]